MKKINISEPYFNQDEIDEIANTLSSKWVTQGPKTEAFEKRFAEYHQVKHAIAVTSCTTGLELVLRALGIKAGDEVIMPALSWVATANAVKILDAVPVFVDVELLSCNLDISQVKAAITPKTKAIIPVHLFGRCLDISALKEILPPEIMVIEDAACAIGASIDGIYYCGQKSDAAVFSFHPRKVITTGEGGMILVNSDSLAQKLRQLRNHGQSSFPSPKPEFQYISDVDALGFNYRMTDIQAGMGLAQLKKLDFLIEKRNEVASLYFELFQDIQGVILPAKANHPKEIITWQSFVILLDTPYQSLRNACMSFLQANGIQTRPATHCLPMLSFYEDPQRPIQAYQTAKDILMTSMSLPIYVGLNRDDILYIKEHIQRFLQQNEL